MNKSDAAKLRAKQWKEKDPEHFAKVGAKSHDAWVNNGRKPRGFSVMNKETLSEVSRRGGANSKRGEN